MTQLSSEPRTFHLVETTLDAIQSAYSAGHLTVRQLVEMYLRRIEAYDSAGPIIRTAEHRPSMRLVRCCWVDAWALSPWPCPEKRATLSRAQDAPLSS